MTDATPPPEQPLSDQARARIRAELLAAARSPSAASRRWAVPATAAASVALVAGLTVWATGAVGGDPGGDDTGPAPGASVTSSPEATPTPEDPTPVQVTPTPTDVVSELSTAVPQPGVSPTPTEGDDEACGTEVARVLRRADQLVAFPDDADGRTSFWVRGDRFVLCDERAGTTTVHEPLPLEPDLDDVATFRVSSTYPPTDDGYRTVRVAGGLVPDGALAFDVAYAFPDGHTERATQITDDQGRTWWRMLYEYDDGGGNETRKPPIEVTVSLSGVQQHFTLEWGADTCAQANHGC